MMPHAIELDASSKKKNTHRARGSTGIDRNEILMASISDPMPPKNTPPRGPASFVVRERSQGLRISLDRQIALER